MLRIICKSKIHGAVVTEKNVNYGGSIKIDKILMEEADILPNEMVLVANLRTGARFETYTIPAEKNSGIIGLQGGAALLSEIGDKLIIISSCLLEDEDARIYKPKFVFVNDKNKIIHKK